MNDHISHLRTLTAQIVCTLFASPISSAAIDPAKAIGDVYAALEATGTQASGSDNVPATTARREPAVSVRKSLASHEHILSMIDGKPYKTLRRHLTTHGFTPDSYRAEFGLKADYPMVAAAYTATRRDLALKIGLGRKPDSVKDDGPTAA